MVLHLRRRFPGCCACACNLRIDDGDGIQWKLEMNRNWKACTECVRFLLFWVRYRWHRRLLTHVECVHSWLNALSSSCFITDIHLCLQTFSESMWRGPFFFYCFCFFVVVVVVVVARYSNTKMALISKSMLTEKNEKRKRKKVHMKNTRTYRVHSTIPNCTCSMRTWSA